MPISVNMPSCSVRRFSEQGIPIKALIARKGPDSSVTWVEPKELARRLEPEEEADPAGEVQE